MESELPPLAVLELLARETSPSYLIFAEIVGASGE
jgi:hypothetical protein